MPRSLKLLIDSYRLFRKHIWLYIGYAAWLLVPFAAFVILTFIPESPLVFALALLIAISQLFISLWVAISIMHLTAELNAEMKIDTKHIQQQALRRVIPMLIVVALQALITIGGIILLVIPGIIFSIWYAFAHFSVALDAKRPLEALSASRSLVKGRFLAVAWRLISGPAIIAFIYAGILGLVVFVISIAVGFDALEILSAQESPLWLQTIEAIGDIFFLPLIIIYGTLLYQWLKFNDVSNRLEKANDVS